MIRMHEDPAVPNRLFRLALLLLLALPFAAYGLVFNYIPYRLIGIGVQRLHTNSTKVHWYQLLLGSIVYLAYYPSLLYAAHRAFASDWSRTLGFAASLLPTGLFARWFLYRLAREKRALRFAWFSAVHRTALSQLRRRRHALIAEMDVHLERYLEAAGVQRDTSAAGTPP